MIWKTAIWFEILQSKIWNDCNQWLLKVLPSIISEHSSNQWFEKLFILAICVFDNTAIKDIEILQVQWFEILQSIIWNVSNAMQSLKILQSMINGKYLQSKPLKYCNQWFEILPINDSWNAAINDLWNICEDQLTG